MYGVTQRTIDQSPPFRYEITAIPVFEGKVEQRIILATRRRMDQCRGVFVLDSNLMGNQPLDQYKRKRFSMCLRSGSARRFIPRARTYVERRRIHVEHVQTKAHPDASFGRVIRETLV